MNKNLLFLIVGLLLGGLAVFSSGWTFPNNDYEPATVTDASFYHYEATPDGHVAKYFTPKDEVLTRELLRSYQIQIASDDRLDVYDEYRYVGSVHLNTNPRKLNELDKLIIGDNE